MARPGKLEVRKTLLIVGEGHDEKALLNHIKSLYCIRAVSVDVKNAGGKGPDHILNYAINCQEYSSRDIVGVLLDTDLVWPKELVKRTTEYGFQLIGTNPSIDGFVLDLLNEKKPLTTAKCKKKLSKLLPGPSTEKETYAKILSKEMLDQSRTKNETLDDIINLIQGIKRK
ncbi:RloB domain-containing protein [Citrobacter farmeri]|uniref:RloB domain-containing protein n=1 Tax=Citrobacter farmeri TaxID=67824 RepID=UPI001904DA12|nr:RloB domain-containing protein [Citrobacter farmeri]EKV7298624.1 RloB domain-containing protein [Citrobacter farmeri]MBJ8745958.1 RloB domain-containing protein [Citrobacter farmeri]MBJ8759209.1 RloB domain-containing protein [Citrobacter farmeri]MBJ9019008.1 RloB domain-containing protein [Citrobacter farmeri]